MSLKLTSYKGTRDLYPADMAERNYIFAGWREVVERYGYQEYQAPMLEPIEMYAAKSGEEIVNEQTYSFQDRGGRQMVIRPEMTPSISRMVAARRQEMPMPARLYSIANFMRYERPQHGREREFWQLNFDLFGISGLHADLEIINLSYDIVRSFGATEDMFTIKVNDRRLTDFIMTAYLGLDGEATTRMIKLLDKFDKMPRTTFDEAAVEIVGPDKMTKLSKIIEATTLDDLPAEVSQSEAAKPLRQLLYILTDKEQRNLGNVVYDVRLMRGFDYYTGIVFEVFDEAPENRRAMFGGGRYDGLISLFGVESLPVVGAAPGETMFREFLHAHKLMPDFSKSGGPEIMILPIPTADESDEVATIVAQTLREQGYDVAVDYTDRKIDKKTKAAVKQHARYVIYLGDEEINAGIFTVKCLTDGQQDKVSFEDLTDYFDDKMGWMVDADDDDDGVEEQEED